MEFRARILEEERKECLESQFVWWTRSVRRADGSEVEMKIEVVHGVWDTPWTNIKRGEVLSLETDGNWRLNGECYDEQ